MSDRNSGFRELQHTADAAIEVWASSVENLFSTALSGMYQLMGVSSNSSRLAESTVIQLEENDLESLLVAFLSECLYFCDSKGLLVNPTHLSIHGNCLEAVCQLATLTTIEKEIKAATYHNLKIINNGNYWQATIVFDL